MAIKAFNVDEATYKEFAKQCKSSGVSMSKQVDLFMKTQISREPRIRAAYARKIEAIRKGAFIKTDIDSVL